MVVAWIYLFIGDIKLPFPCDLLLITIELNNNSQIKIHQVKLILLTIETPASPKPFQLAD